MLINEMRICEECYYHKIGQNYALNECKICNQFNEDDTRPYFLCKSCEELYLDFNQREKNIVNQSN